MDWSKAVSCVASPSSMADEEYLTVLSQVLDDLESSNDFGFLGNSRVPESKLRKVF